MHDASSGFSGKDQVALCLRSAMGQFVAESKIEHCEYVFVGVQPNQKFQARSGLTPSLARLFLA